MTRPGLKVAGLILAGASGGVAAYEMMVPLLSQSPRLAAGGGAASPLAGAAQPAAAGAIPGLREAGRSHASAAALLHPGEWLCPSSWMAWEDELWVAARPAAGSRPISATLAMGAGAVAARGHTSPRRHSRPHCLSRPARDRWIRAKKPLARSSATRVGFTAHYSSLRWRR